MSYPLQVAKIKAKRKLTEEDGPVPEDGYLYKYRSLKKGPERKNTLAILKNNQLWWGRGSNFNDPFDCSHHIDYERTDEEWEEFFARGFDKGRQFVRSKIAEAKAHVRGDGFVATQFPEPGSVLPRGSTVRIRLARLVVGARPQTSSGNDGGILAHDTR